MTRQCVEQAVAAMDSALRGLGDRFVALADPGIDAETERRLWLTSDNSSLEAVSRAAFDSFADSLADKVGGRCHYDDQKEGVRELIATVEAYAGNRLTRKLQTPKSPSDDETSLFSDFRNQYLILLEHPVATEKAVLVAGVEVAADRRYASP